MMSCGSKAVLLAVNLGLFAGTTVALGADAEPKDPNHIATVTMYVKPNLVDCVGVAPRKCMVVREGKKGKWQNFYDSIAGFKFEEGFWYELKVDKFKVPNPPADGSSIRYKLVKLVSKKKDDKS